MVGRERVENLKYKMSHMGIKNNTLLVVSTVVIIFVLVFILIFAMIFRDRLTREGVMYSENLLGNVEENLVAYFDEVSAIANEPNYDYELQNYLKSEINKGENYISISNGKCMQDYEMSSKLFQNDLNRRTDVSSIFIFGEKRVLLYRSIYQLYSIVQDYSQEQWYAKAVEAENSYAVTGPCNHLFLQGDSDETISVSRKIISQEDGSILGVMLVDLNLNKIEEICGTLYPRDDGNFCLISDGGDVVYEKNEAQKDQKYSLRDGHTMNDLFQTIKNADTELYWEMNGESYQVVTEKIEKIGWIAVTITPLKAIRRTMYENILTYLMIGIGILLVIIFILNLLLKRIVKPIVTLADKMDIEDVESLNMEIPVETADETGRLARSFNKMLKKIGLLLDQVVEEQEEKRKYELQMLQAQINPHFLYNTLDSIIWMAEMKDESVVPMTEALAKLFRISLNKGNEFITIKDELEHVRNYLVIQSMRYEDKFEYFIQATEEVLTCKTIKLIVQPIVENCIYHGIKKMKGKGTILISAVCKGDDVIIKVTDNGVGMEQNICDEILVKESRFENTSGSGIGVKNVNERIKLYFGDKYGLSYISQLGKGTTVTIKVPKIMNCEVDRR